LLTAGVPGAGKSSVVSQLGLVDEGWRRLDADVVKDYLLEDLVVTGRVEDLLVRELADAHPVMPAFTRAPLTQGDCRWKPSSTCADLTYQSGEGGTLEGCTSLAGMKFRCCTPSARPRTVVCPRVRLERVC